MPSRVLQATEPDSGARRSSPLPVPPDDVERLAYLSRPQHRWIFAASALAFAGVAYSLAGLATRTPALLLLLCPLVVMVAEQALTLRTSTFRRRVGLEDHAATVELWDPPSVPSVDVFLPSAGEPLDVLRNTYLHVLGLSWDGDLRVTVLDDADRAEVRDLARAHGFDYLARRGSSFKKAGNLQHAFERTSAEHILILDADFVPRPDLLRHLVPYLDVPTVGIVQSPQFFHTDRRMHWLPRAAGVTQELFFRFIQPSRDAVDAAICVGTSAVYRRSALEAIGGFPLVEHSEDVMTGIRMADAGYSLQYVPVVVSRGQCPDDVDSFVAQQYRWCEGSMGLLADPAFHAPRRMTLNQRLSYWSGFLYYVSTALLAVTGPLPVLIMVLFFPHEVSARTVLPLAGTVALWLVVFPATSCTRWRPEVLRVQLLSGIAHLLCIVDLVRERSEEWVATGRAGSRSRLARRLRLVALPYLVVTQVAGVACLVWASATVGPGAYWANDALAVLQLYVVVPVIRLLWPRRTSRRRTAAVAPVAAAPVVTTIDLRGLDLIPTQSREGQR